MNKTVNINLAGIFFHIDEDAYLKLQRYLDAIKRSFTDSQGRSEIIADIEARISELFGERVKHDKQVIGVKEVDEVITIMGQPEDYLVDDEIFEDEPQPSYKSSKESNYSKKLYRDTDNSYIAGVASGLGHYLGIDAMWVRLLWILLTLGSGGTFVLIYVLFWVLVPEALTTSEKLTMKGEPVNISNIEKKIKDGFDNVSQNVSDAVKNIDLPKQSNRIKSSSKSFFDTIGDIIMFFLKIVSKFIGIILMIVGASTLIMLIIALFSVGVADVINIPGIDFFNAANAADIPVWLMSFLLFFAVGIPFFFVFYLGLKILVNNLKSIGNIAKFSLFGLWLMAIIGLAFVGVKQASEFSEEASVVQREQLNIPANDTLFISMKGNPLYSKQFGRHSNTLKPVYNENDQKLLYRTDVRLIIKPTRDSVASISIDKNSRGNSYKNAKMRAEKIDYNYRVNGNRLDLDGFLTTAFENKFRDQQVEVIVYVPEGTILFADENTNSFQGRYHYTYSTNYDDADINTVINNNGKILQYGNKGHYFRVLNDELECLNCWDDEEFKMKIDLNDDDSEFIMDEDGLRIKNDSTSIEINKNGVKSNSESVRVNIDKNGIEITSDDN
ncbi:MAG: PspC domain-containing protein [Aquaticitalea sp.]